MNKIFLIKETIWEISNLADNSINTGKRDRLPDHVEFEVFLGEV